MMGYQRIILEDCLSRIIIEGWFFKRLIEGWYLIWSKSAGVNANI